MMSGSGSIQFGPCASVSRYGVSNDVWKTLWIFQWFGNSILNAAFDMMATTQKGLYHLGDNFGVTFAGKFKLVPSSQTLSPIANGLYLGFSFIQLSCALCWASWVASLASLILVRHFSRVGMSVDLVG